jgi:hypothetical protein
MGLAKQGSQKQRDRGRILKPEALQRLQEGIRAWEIKYDRRCTQERLRELTGQFKEGGLDQSTISKILKARKRVDPESIRFVFKAVGLELYDEDLVSTSELSAHIQLTRTPKIDWGEKPDTSIFFGRVQELVMLQEWIVREQCRVVTLLGMGGIGKTFLAARLSDQIQNYFDYVIWRSLREAPPLDEILVLIIQFLSQQQETEIDLPRRLGERLNRLLYYLRKFRCLLVLDNVESMLEAESTGQYRKGYESYGELV